MTARRSDRLAIEQTLRDIRCAGIQQAQAVPYPRFLSLVQLEFDHEDTWKPLVKHVSAETSEGFVSAFTQSSNPC